MPKLLFLVLDGAADRPEPGSETPLEVASKPGIDSIARRSRCGLMYVLGRGRAPESDAAVMALLGHDPDEYYPGRGAVEALGAGVELGEGDVAFRANFATVDPRTLRIVDRRAGRDVSPEEASDLAAALDGLELDGVRVRVRPTLGHRAVVVFSPRSGRLSPSVGNTDPAYVRSGRISVAVPKPGDSIVPCEPLSRDPAAEATAAAANEFTRRAVEILDSHPVNRIRRDRGSLPANAILLRDAGGAPRTLSPIWGSRGLRFGAVAEMPVEVGVARLLGMEVAQVPPPTGDLRADAPSRLEATLRLLNSVDGVYVHLKGPDEPGHDGNFSKKVAAIEAIDSAFVSPLLGELDPSEVGLVVTSDHATPWRLRSHSDDPVPVALTAPGSGGDGVDSFDEVCCGRGSLGVIDHARRLLPEALDEIFGPA